MIFSIVVTALVLAIAYFHFVQGLFSGLISMVLAILAATLALGYHESIVTGLLGGKVADAGSAMTICVIFALVYGVGRIAFDSLIPGNVRLPFYVDRVGGLACGVVVGIFAAGTFAFAAQSMAFGPAVIASSRYPLAEPKEVTIAGARGRNQQTAVITDALELEGDANFPDESKDGGLWINADAMVVDFTAFQSASGALAGGTSLRDRHPSWLREMFFQRLGVEPAAKRSALNVSGRTDITVEGLFAPAALGQMDGEDPLIRNRKLPKQVKSDPTKQLLVVRVSAAKLATDTDSRFRFSLGSVRLVAGAKDYYPFGVVYQPGTVNIVMVSRVDDYLHATLGGDNKTTIDLAFLVDRDDLLADANAKTELKVKPGTFIEVKRFARVDLGEKDVAATPPTAVDDGMEWKNGLVESVPTRLAEGDGAPAK